MISRSSCSTYIFQNLPKGNCDIKIIFFGYFSVMSFVGLALNIHLIMNISAITQIIITKSVIVKTKRVIEKRSTSIRCSLERYEW